jgi:hypothetical protein
MGIVVSPLPSVPSWVTRSVSAEQVGAAVTRIWKPLGSNIGCYTGCHSNSVSMRSPPLPFWSFSIYHSSSLRSNLKCNPLYSQQPATTPSSEPSENTVYRGIVSFHIHFNIILSYTNRSQSRLLTWGFPTSFISITYSSDPYHCPSVDHHNFRWRMGNMQLLILAGRGSQCGDRCTPYAGMFRVTLCQVPVRIVAAET